TYSPWFNEQNSKWWNYDVNACLKYNKGIIDGVVGAGWKVNYIRMHMDPYWSNTPGIQTTGENDISAFSFERFKKYLDAVFIPMAEYAISKGLYVVMRPPGVCPEKIEVGGKYHNYLKQVWSYVAMQTRLTDNPHVMFELANEPVQILGTDGRYGSGTDACNKNLTKFFQEIVDIMRENGCKNILWVPGTGYQSQYAGFVDYPVKGENIGYAVHVYPGWYGSDAIEPSHELGGSYGGGYEAFAAGWKNSIEPCAAIAPILVTEMDWLPSVYKASWGKSITGKMLGSGFGANFKLLADRTGNVSWMLFTGPELLKNYNGVAGTEGNYTMYNDPDGCIWAGYHWYQEYAGAALPDIKSVNLYLSPRSDVPSDKKTILTGGTVGAALIA
ncbi:MAG: glycoside hydrolase family 5 protein, partial [Duncaniella sp.]|nr:glycoside hydrolase family 5 protein [Duncaniella sp.]